MSRLHNSEKTLADNYFLIFIAYTIYSVLIINILIIYNRLIFYTQQAMINFSLIQ